MKGIDLTTRVKELAEEVGYVACGITTAEPFKEYEHALDNRVEQFGESRKLYDEMRYRVDPRRTAPWARSIIVCVRRYGKYRLPAQAVGHIGRNYLTDRRYEGCPDHTMPKRMQAGMKELGIRVKRGGVPDRAAAARAGVASFGRNTFAYSEHGSWINIETWRVDAELSPDEPLLESPCPDGCRKCIDACPTGALCEPFVQRIDHCAAYLTYHAAEPIDPSLWAKMGKWIYGCDICQEVCPLNKGKWEEEEDAPWLDEIAEHLSPQALAVMDQQTYESVIHPRFWYIAKDNLARWHANAGRAAGQRTEDRVQRTGTATATADH
jgi:epoxyqueuosine reductase